MVRHGRVRPRQQRPVPPTAGGRARDRVQGVVRPGPLTARRGGPRRAARRSSTSRRSTFRHEPIAVEMWVTKMGGAGFDIGYDVSATPRTSAPATTRGPRRASWCTTSPTSRPRRMRRTRKAISRGCAARRFPSGGGGDPRGPPRPRRRAGYADLRTFVTRRASSTRTGRWGSRPRHRPAPTYAASCPVGADRRRGRRRAGRCGWADRPGSTRPCRWPRSPTASRMTPPRGLVGHRSRRADRRGPR